MSLKPLRRLSERHRKAILSFLARVRERLRDVEVYLTGSLARGDWLLDSDVDLVVVSDELAGLQPWERYAFLRQLAPPDVPFDIMAYTRVEFERLLALREALVNPEPLLRLL